MLRVWPLYYGTFQKVSFPGSAEYEFFQRAIFEFSMSEESKFAVFKTYICLYIQNNKKDLILLLTLIFSYMFCANLQSLKT